MDHQAQDAHLGSAALVQLLGTEGQLLIGTLVAQEADWDHGSTEVAREGGLVLLPQADFQHTDEANDLGNSGSRDGGDGGKSGRDVGELGARKVNVSWKTDSGPGGQVSEEGKLADTSVLDLDVTKAVEGGLVATGEHAQRIEVSKGWLHTKLVLEGHLGGDRGLGDLGRGKGSGGGNSAGEDGELHLYFG